jgi:cytidyltransferase-like protein
MKSRTPWLNHATEIEGEYPENHQHIPLSRPTSDSGIQMRGGVVTIGGTFDELHPGHKEYIKMAFAHGGRVMIYVTSDEYISDQKKYLVQPFEIRVEQLKRFVSEIDCQDRYDIRSVMDAETVKRDYLHDPYLSNNVGMAIVPPEYYDSFREINSLRQQMGKKSFLILVKQRSRNESNIDISSTSIHKHLLDHIEDELPSENMSDLAPKPVIESRVP